MFLANSLMPSAPLAVVVTVCLCLRQKTIMSVVELHFIITDLPVLLAREVEESPLNALLHQRTCC